jgi:hypothetical protein
MARKGHRKGKVRRKGYKKCIINRMRVTKFKTQKSARKAFARAAKKCSKLARKGKHGKRKGGKKRKGKHGKRKGTRKGKCLKRARKARHGKRRCIKRSKR